MNNIHLYYFDRPDLKDYHVIMALKKMHNTSFRAFKITVSNTYNVKATINVCIDSGHRLPEKVHKKIDSGFWCLHCHSKKHQDFAKLFGKSFGVDKFYVDKKLFNFWVPNGVGLAGFVIKNSVTPKYDLGFIGQYLGSRPRTLKKLEKICLKNNWSYNFVDTRAGIRIPEKGPKEGPNTTRPNWKSKEAFTRLLSECKVILNITGSPQKHLLNSRIFEGIVVERPVLSDIVIGAKETISDTVGIVYFDRSNFDTFEYNLNRLLSDGVFYKHVVDQGQKVKKDHTIDARLHVILNKMLYYHNKWNKK